MFPSECVLELRVRSDGDDDLADTNLPLYILECEDRKAEGYAGKKLEIYNKRLQRMKIGVRLATPPAVSYLAILGSRLYAKIVAVDKTGIVIYLGFTCDRGRMSYLIYDAVGMSLRMIPTPDDLSWNYTITSKVSFARGDASYALVHTGRMDDVDKVDNLYLWRPSSSSPPWSEKRKPTSRSRDLIVHEIDADFSFNGHAYWVDLLCGVSYYRCDALFNDNTSVVKFRGFIPLPVEDGSQHRSNTRLAGPAAYRTMGVVRDSFIRFVSIDGFQNYVKLKNRTVTVWKLLGHDQDEPWEEEHKFSLKTLWGFEGFGDLPKNLTPMNPLLSAKDADVVYLMLGEYREDQFNFRFFPYNPRYLLAIDMRNKTVTSVPLDTDWSPDYVSCPFSRKLRKALVGPCNDKGIPMMKKEHAGRDDDGGNVVADAPNPMKKKKKKNKRKRKEEA